MLCAALSLIERQPRESLCSFSCRADSLASALLTANRRSRNIGRSTQLDDTSSPSPQGPRKPGAPGLESRLPVLAIQDAFLPQLCDLRLRVAQVLLENIGAVLAEQRRLDIGQIGVG